MPTGTLEIVGNNCEGIPAEKGVFIFGRYDEEKTHWTTISVGRAVALKGRINNILRYEHGLENAGATHIIWVTTPDLNDEQRLDSVKRDLANTLKPSDSTIFLPEDASREFIISIIQEIYKGRQPA